MEIVGAITEQVKMNNHVSLDIERLKESLQEELESLLAFSNKYCSIYRVPRRLRGLREYAYTPQIVSIGPLHHGKEELKEMEVHKKLYLKEFLKLGKVSVEKYIIAIAERETRLRNCYADNFEQITTEDFVKMMLLDTSFIIMVFLKQCSVDFQINDDRIFCKPWRIVEVIFDMCLLENQIPFFILDDLMKVAEIQIQGEAGYSMIELTHVFFSCAFGDSWVPKDILEQINSSEVEHFVDFLRICLQPKKRKQRKCLETRTTLSAMELHQSGVKFQCGSSEALFDINFDFEKRILEIPPLFFKDYTEKLFRNLHAFEQCQYSGGCVSDYIATISFLVRATNDVEILSKKGIIGNWLNDNDAVIRVLHDLGRENKVNPKLFYFADVIEDLNKYCRKQRHRWIADLKQTYFHNPWVSISVTAVGTLLILTVIQAVCSVIQVW
ncbi:UPF0481 protein [Salix suchowensis]|nr:UPF0481 protein [Salix suchowensis]